MSTGCFVLLRCSPLCVHVIMLYILLTYFIILFVVSRLATRKSTDAAFYRGDRQSPWYMVAFGMVGASISGVTFVSVPGMVLHSGFTYLEVCAGFIVGYFIVAYVLLPIYYKENLTSIYEYLKRISDEAYRTGSLFFIISKLLGASAKFYVPCFIISSVMEWNFPLTVVGMLLLVWLYTRRGGIKSLVWTDTLQTLCMLACLVLLIYNIQKGTPSSSSVLENGDYAIFQSFGSVINFLSGIFIVIVMTGLDQDMMQKNLTCRTLRDAQKDMCTYGFAFLPVNALFLLLGVMLVGTYNASGVPLPAKPDELLTIYCTGQGGVLLSVFVLGIVATSFSTVDSALTALTTSFCLDIIPGKGGKHKRGVVHFLMTLLLAVCCILFHQWTDMPLIDIVYTLVGYTYGPLLGLFVYAMLNPKRKPLTVLIPCLLSPVLCYVLSWTSEQYWNYHFGYELLLINGLLTYIGLFMSKKEFFLR